MVTNPSPFDRPMTVGDSAAVEQVGSLPDFRSVEFVRPEAIGNNADAFEDQLVPPTPEITPNGSLHLPAAVLADLRMNALLKLGHAAVALSQEGITSSSGNDK